MFDFTAVTVACIDIGSSSMYCHIAKVLPTGGVVSLQRLKQPAKLRADIDENGELSQLAIMRGCEALALFAEAIGENQVSHVKAIATYTVRSISNVDEVVAAFGAALGYPIDVITGLEEAQLVYLGASQGKPRDGAHLMVDIGGGSTELIRTEGSTVLHACSLPMGCVSFTADYFTGGQLSEAAFNAAEHAARQEIQPHISQLIGATDCYASGGTVNAVIAMLGKQCVSSNDLLLLRAQVLSKQAITHLHLPGLREDRAGVLPGGLAILAGVLSALSLSEFQHAQGGVREGMLLFLIEELQLKKHL